MKKLISVCVPCRNEVGNVAPLSEEIVKQLEQLPQYDFEIIFIDNCSEDGTQDILREICAKDNRIKAILNAKNFPYGSGLHVIFQAHGDCVISIPADFQIPVELIPEMITAWERGAKVVALQKKSGKHDKIRFIRKLYYRMSKQFSDHDSLPGFTGSGLYDKSFITMCKTRHDPLIWSNMYHMVAQYAAPLVKKVYHEQPRRSGKTNNSVNNLIDTAIMRFTTISDVFPRYAILAGLLTGVASLFISFYYLIRKLLDWHNFPLGMAPLIIGMFFLGAIQLIFLGIMGEYILKINKRQKNEPHVIEKERINFEDISDENKE